MVKGELAQGQLKIKPFSCRPLGPPSYGIQGMKYVCTLESGASLGGRVGGGGVRRASRGRGGAFDSPVELS